MEVPIEHLLLPLSLGLWAIFALTLSGLLLRHARRQRFVGGIHLLAVLLLVVGLGRGPAACARPLAPTRSREPRA